MESSDYDMQLVIAKQKFHDECDITYLADLLRSDKELTHETRVFIADVLDGKEKRKRGARKHFHERDYEITCKIDSLIGKGASLTSSRDKAGAGAIIAEEFGISEDVAIKAYQKVISNLIRCKEIDREAWSAYMEENPDLFP